jgi:hypothetical protein
LVLRPHRALSTSSDSLTFMWEEIGYSQSPYGTDALPATASGAGLLVGRDHEVEALIRRLTYATTHPTIEGDNGVGKTSLVSVAGYRAMEARLTGERRQYFLPLPRTFQLGLATSPDAFRREVYMAVAEGFVSHHAHLREAGLQAPDVGAVDQWLNSPLFHGGGGGLSVAGFGGNASRETAPNSGEGFSEAGLARIVEQWLAECFPGTLAGGFICVIDNLEILRTSQAARGILEELRDTVLAQQGLRWVLCGARGIIRTAASSPRLEGRLSAPIELPPINVDSVSEVVARRLSAFQTSENANPPVDPDGFRYLYEVLNANLRNALMHAENYSVALADAGGERPISPEEKLSHLKTWLRDTADSYHSATTGVGGRAWDVFEGLVVLDGQCSPSDYDQFGFTAPEAMRAQVRALEESQLVQSERDDTDNRRKTISMTPRGWLIHYRLNGYEPRTR